MKIKFKKKKCLICDKAILLYDNFKCNRCNNYYHKICLIDALNINNNINNKCIVCQYIIHLQTNWVYEISRNILFEISPCIFSTGLIIGLFIFFTR